MSLTLLASTQCLHLPDADELNLSAVHCAAEDRGQNFSLDRIVGLGAPRYVQCWWKTTACWALESIPVTA